MWPETPPFKVEERKTLGKTNPRGRPETEEVLQKSGEERASEQNTLENRMGEDAGGHPRQERMLGGSLDRTCLQAVHPQRVPLDQDAGWFP